MHLAPVPENAPPTSPTPPPSLAQRIDDYIDARKYGLSRECETIRAMAASICRRKPKHIRAILMKATRMQKCRIFGTSTNESLETIDEMIDSLNVHHDIELPPLTIENMRAAARWLVVDEYGWCNAEAVFIQEALLCVSSHAPR